MVASIIVSAEQEPWGGESTVRLPVRTKRLSRLFFTVQKADKSYCHNPGELQIAENELDHYV